MNPAEFKTELTREPFRPFNLYYPSGKVYAIRSQNQAVLSPSTRTLIIVKPPAADSDPGGIDLLDVIMIERLELLEEAPLPPHWWLRKTDDDA